MRSGLTAAIITMAAAFLGIQALPIAPATNPPVRIEQTLGANVVLPQNVSDILDKACKNCHSNETKWPWYSRLAPGKWLVAQDVNKARKAMNISEWSTQAGRSPETAAATLAAACADVRSGRMPLPQYRMMHPEARLSPAEVETFCTWTVREGRRLVMEKKRRLQEVASLTP
jgi:hypothetical protein